MKPSRNKKLAKLKADKYFSEYIRKRDKNKPCVTCGAFAQKDCGHFISRRFENTRYDEMNSHGQCLKCNRFEHGNQFEYSLSIDRMYGKGTAEKLRMKAQQRSAPRTKYDYEIIAETYKEKIKKL